MVTERELDEVNAKAAALAEAEQSLRKKKTIFVMVTVVGCIAILWPRIISPMLTSAPPQTPTHTYPSPGCCKLNHQQFSNLSLNGDTMRSFKVPEEIAYRQERPSHFKDTGGMHPAMKERGRTIPPTKTVPIVEKRPGNTYVHHVEGRPGPIPGMRAAMAGAQAGGKRAKDTGGSTGFLMTVYTIGIMVFFVYTIVNYCKKKKVPEPAENVPKRTEFKQQVFRTETNLSKLQQKKIGWEEHQTNLQDNNQNNNSIVVKDTPDIGQPPKNTREVISPISPISPIDVESSESLVLLDIAALKQRLRQTENKMCSIIAVMSETEKQAALKHKSIEEEAAKAALEIKELAEHDEADADIREELKLITEKLARATKLAAKREANEHDNCTVKVMGLEVTTTNDGNKSWSRPQTPSVEPEPVPQSIYLEGTIGPDSNILVKDAETKTDEVLNDDEYDADEQMVVLSSKMTLSLINVDNERVN